MYGILAEDSSDIECLKVLIKRLENNPSTRIKGKGFGGCSKMLRDGWKTLKLYANSGCTKLIICIDCDKETTLKRYQKVISDVIKPSGIKKTKHLICILIPKEEMEAWILADIKAVSTVISSWKPTQNFSNPETTVSPKETLKKLSRTRQSKPLYIYTLHNQQILKNIDLEQVKNKCPSFQELANFVENNTANYPQ